MGAAKRYGVSGAVMVVVGVLLWRFAGGIETPVFTLTKVGAVLMVVGAAELGYGLYLAVRGERSGADR